MSNHYHWGELTPDNDPINRPTTKSDLPPRTTDSLNPCQRHPSVHPCRNRPSHLLHKANSQTEENLTCASLQEIHQLNRESWEGYIWLPSRSVTLHSEHDASATLCFCTPLSSFVHHGHLPYFTPSSSDIRQEVRGQFDSHCF